MEFKNFELHPDLQKGIDEAGYINCMPVQEQVLKSAFGGQDLYVQSQTGTGKTAAFLTVIMQRMLTEEALFKRKALIMAPTRELAVQIEEEAKKLGKYLPFKCGSFYGGVGYAQQEKLLRENAQILVGTPGRVLDLNSSGKMNLMDISFLVLDEADRMFDMGFYPDLRKLIQVVPPADRRQTMLFSATLNAWVKNLAWEYTKKPFEIEIAPEVVTVEEITQILYHVPSQEKTRLLLGILKQKQPESAIIFCNTKKTTEIIAKRLKMNGYNPEFIIGDLPQVKRLKVIEDVKSGKIKILVATDVAARGLDVESLSMVINYDLPNEAENYVHRIGRTARAGKTGIAITLASEHDVYELPAVERYIGKKIPSEIASEELYEEDKSADRYIQTEYYEDRRPHDSSRREKRGGKRRDSARGDKPAAANGRASAASKRNRGRNENNFSRAQKPQTSRESFNDKDISRLSMEERMALYKKKYSGAETGAAQNKAEKNNSTRANIKNGGKKDYKKQNAKRRKKGGQARNAEMRKPQIEQKAKPAAAEKKAAPRKGIISKIIGLFSKK